MTSTHQKYLCRLKSIKIILIKKYMRRRFVVPKMKACQITLILLVAVGFLGIIHTVYNLNDLIEKYCVCEVDTRVLQEIRTPDNNRKSIDNGDSFGEEKGNKTKEDESDSSQLDNNKICSQHERLNYLQSKCQDHQQTVQRWRNVPIFIVDDEHKVAYCDIAKAASTTTKTLMMMSTSQGRKLPKPVAEKAEPHNLHEQQKRGLRKIQYSAEALKGYTKFLITRNPYERLVSTYMEKYAPYTHNDTFYRNVRLSMLKAVGKTSEDQLTFADLSQIVIKNLGPGFRADVHINTYSLLCKPCSIKYDYIFRVETYHNDIQMLLPLLRQTTAGLANATGNVSYKSKRFQKSEDFGKYLMFMDELSQYQVMTLKSFYYFDDALFGYGMDQSHRTYCAIKTPSGKTCC